MTAKQHQYLICIREFVKTMGYFPRFTEIGKRMGISSSGTVHKAIQQLMTQGYVCRTSSGLFELVPARINTENWCDKGHPRIWYLQPACPLCEVLKRVGI